MPKKISKFLLPLLLIPTLLFAQSTIEDNPYFKRSMELRRQSEEALTKGDYDAAYRYAEEGLKELEKFESVNSYLLAEQRMNTARQRGLNNQDPELFAQIVEEVDAARANLQAEKFAEGKSHSDSALVLLDQLMSQTSNLVETYTVVKGDSLWKIAGRPSIYGDPFAWPRIYMANKHKLRYPENPDLIYPGQIFDIPR